LAAASVEERDAIMIVLTTPTGTIGGQVLAGLLEEGSEPIRVVARNPSRLPAEIRSRVEIVEGSHSRRDVVERAFRDADSLFWLVASDPRAESAVAAYVDFARPACEVLKDGDIRHIVGISALGRGWPRDAGLATATLKMDDMIAATGVHYRALTCASLMENVLRQGALMRGEGVYYWPTPADLKEPACATRDVAAVAVKLLRDRSWTGFAEVPMLGPEDLSGQEMMAIVSDVLGRPVEYHEMTMEDMKSMMLKRGASEGMAQAMVNMSIAKNEGLDHMVARTAPLLNSTTFRQWCEMALKPAVEV
jgi:uncharacterized protein YbjT (DUF2867 family)